MIASVLFQNVIDTCSYIAQSYYIPFQDNQCYIKTQAHKHLSVLTGICVLSSRTPYVPNQMKHWTKDYKLALTFNL